jgi:RHS repeat-associated protein
MGGVTVSLRKDSCSGNCKADRLHPAPAGSMWIQYRSNELPAPSQDGAVEFKTRIRWNSDDGVAPNGSSLAMWLSDTRGDLYNETVNDFYGEGRWSSGAIECATPAPAADTSLSTLQSRTNFGTDQLLKVGTIDADPGPRPTDDPEHPTPTPAPRSETWWTLLTYDVAASIPPIKATDIISAYMRVELLDFSGSSAGPIEVCRVAQTWQERGATYDRRPSIDEASCRLWSVDILPGVKTLDVTDLAKAWVAGTHANYGVVLRPRTSNNGLFTFGSRESRLEERRPTAGICWQTESPAPTPTPPTPTPPTPTPPHGDPAFPDPPSFDVPIEAALNPPTPCGLDTPHSGGIDILGTEDGCNPCCTGTGFRPPMRNAGELLGSGVGVYLHSGEAYATATDLEIPGLGFPYRLERKYRSGMRYEGVLGYGWSTSYERRLFRPADGGPIQRIDGQGRVDAYTVLPDGTIGAPPGSFTTLRQHPDGTLVERDRGGTTVTYGAPNAEGVMLMTALADRHGNTMRFEHDATGRLQQVVDTLGRRIEYAYDTEGRIVAVTDFAGRQVRYDYDASNNLVAVTSPRVSGTLNGNDFPNGRTTAYEYSADESADVLQHNLVAITMPNEVVSGGQPRVRLTYDPSDRVAALEVGGTNATGVAAGGTVTYEYAVLTVPTPQTNDAVGTTTVTDRNGNRTVYELNAHGNIVAEHIQAARGIQPGGPAEVVRRFEYDDEGLQVKSELPEGNWTETRYDSGAASALMRGNAVAMSRHADADRGGDPGMLTATYGYEPAFNEVRTMTEARGHDLGYRPGIPLPGETYPNPARYTTVLTYDYQEGERYQELGSLLGIDAAEMRQLLAAHHVPMGLGDVNGDGNTAGIAGDVVRIEHPPVQLGAASHMSEFEPDLSQERVELFRYNARGQLIWRRDAEGSVTEMTYHPANDPDGDGQDLTPGVGSEPFGYLRTVRRDAGVEARPPASTIYLPSTAQRAPIVARSTVQSDAHSSIRAVPAASSAANITQSFTYDRVGNVTRRVDARGVATDYTVTALNEVIQVVRAADVSRARASSEEPRWSACVDDSLPECAAGMVAFAYRARYAYDANGNLVRREDENRDAQESSGLGEWVQSDYLYDIRNQLIEARAEIGPAGAVAIERYRYDRNGNRVLVVSPVAALPPTDAAAQPNAVTSVVYDDRDLPYSLTRGGVTDQFRGLAAHADIAELASIEPRTDLATVTRSYDGNGNPVTYTDAEDNTGDGKGETTRVLYDGFDRAVSTVDALGNQTLSAFDAAGQLVDFAVFGPTGGDSPSDARAATLEQPLSRAALGQPLLSEMALTYDEAGRVTARHERLAVYDDVAYARPPVLAEGARDGPGDGWVTTLSEYDRKGRLRFAISDDQDTTTYEYDGADRLVKVVDPEGNEMSGNYDDADNLTRVTTVERTRAADVAADSVPDLTRRFESVTVFDALGRPIRRSDTAGNTVRMGYDSRDNVVTTWDAQYSQDDADLVDDPLAVVAPARKINRPGNATHAEHNGLGWLMRSTAELRVDGQGALPLDTSNVANPDARVTLSSEFDEAGRVVAMTDDTGATTRYQYDELNRLVRVELPGGGAQLTAYDRDGHVREFRDANGSVVTTLVDGLGRPVQLQIAPGPGIVGTTSQTREFDGLSRLRLATDNNDPASAADDEAVTLRYDSLGRVLEEEQNGFVVASSWAGDGRRLALTYPDGRSLRFTHSGLDDLASVAEQRDGSLQVLAEYARIGTRRIVERHLANGTTGTALNEARTSLSGYDEAGRLTELRHVRSDGTLVAGVTYDYSRAGLPERETKHHDPANAEVYPYDSLQRMVGFERGQLSSASDAIELPSPNALSAQSWLLDGAGDWARTDRTSAGEQVPEVRNHSLRHTVTQIGDGALHYDSVGNLEDDGSYAYEWDALGRLRRVSRSATGASVASYTYDALNRRTTKHVTESGPLDGLTQFVHFGEQEIEERDAADALTRQYIFGSWIDEPILMDVDGDGDGRVDGAADTRVFYHQNAQFSTYALTDSAGRVIEGYQYDPYGRPYVYTPGANGRIDWGGDDVVTPEGPGAVGNPYLYTGRRYEPETGLYYYRARYLSPSLGRFISPDPLGTWAMPNLGNAFAYVANRPQLAVDPAGTRAVSGPFAAGGGEHIPPSPGVHCQSVGSGSADCNAHGATEYQGWDTGIQVQAVSSSEVPILEFRTQAAEVPILNFGSHALGAGGGGGPVIFEPSNIHLASVSDSGAVGSPGACSGFPGNGGDVVPMLPDVPKYEIPPDWIGGGGMWGDGGPSNPNPGTAIKCKCSCINLVWIPPSLFFGNPFGGLWVETTKSTEGSTYDPDCNAYCAKVYETATCRWVKGKQI